MRTRRGTTTFLTIAFLGALAALNFQPAVAKDVPPVNSKTDNESVDVVIDWDPPEIQAGQPVEFTLNFKDPSSGQAIQHVNYHLAFMDETGTAVESFKDLHTHDGNDAQSVTFDTVGNFELAVTILGTGLTKPFDTAQSGTLELPIIVVPEFPFAPLILAATTGLVIVFLKLRMRKQVG